MDRLFLFIGFCARIVAPFNFDIRENALRTIWSPVIRATVDPNITRNELMEDIQSSYFGFALKYDNTTERFIISAPKMTDASNPTNQAKVTSNVTDISAQGSIEIVAINFTSNDIDYTSARYPDVESGDSFALVLGDRGNSLLACSPAKVLQCSGIALDPGFCYESPNFGNNWTMSDVTDAECPKGGLDFTFLLDGSGSILWANFEIIKDWVWNLTYAFEKEISTGRTKVAVTQYSGKPQTEIELGNYADFDDLQRRIKSISYTPLPGTFTAKALDKIMEDFQASERFNDPTVTQVMVLLTDGKATDWRSLPTASKNLSDLGIIPFVVGVRNYDSREIKLIAGNENRAFGVAEWEGLDDTVKSLLTDIKTVALEGSSGIVTSDYKQTGFSTVERVSVLKAIDFTTV